MPAQNPEQSQPVTPFRSALKNSSVLCLRVRNHPGVMSHVCGLFARRAFNLEGIYCIPVEDGSQSVMWLLVGDSRPLDQVVKQLGKLEDVLELRQEQTLPEFFGQVA